MQKSTEFTLQTLDVEKQPFGIPYELWDVFFEDLSQRDLVNFTLVCKAFQFCIKKYGKYYQDRYQFSDKPYRLSLQPTAIEWRMYYDETVNLIKKNKEIIKVYSSRLKIVSNTIRQRCPKIMDAETHQRLQDLFSKQDVGVHDVCSFTDSTDLNKEFSYLFSQQDLSVHDVNRLTDRNHLNKEFWYFLSWNDTLKFHMWLTAILSNDYLQGKQESLDQIFIQFTDKTEKKFGNEHNRKRFIKLAILYHQPFDKILPLLKDSDDVLNIILSYAVFFNYYAILPQLFSLGANPEQGNNAYKMNYHSHLIEAVQCGHLETTRLLIKQNANVNYCAIRYNERPTAIYFAASHLDFQIGNLLLNIGATVPQQSLLWWPNAIEWENVKACRTLLNAGVEIPSTWTLERVLNFFVCSGHLRDCKDLTVNQINILTILLEAGLILDSTSMKFVAENEFFSVNFFANIFAYVSKFREKHILEDFTTKAPRILKKIIDLNGVELFHHILTHQFISDELTRLLVESLDKSFLRIRKVGNILHAAVVGNNAKFIEDFFALKVISEELKQELLEEKNVDGFTPLELATHRHSIEAVLCLLVVSNEFLTTTKDEFVSNLKHVLLARPGLLEEIFQLLKNNDFDLAAGKKIWQEYANIPNFKSDIVIWCIRQFDKEEIPDALMEFSQAEIEKKKLTLSEIDQQYGSFFCKQLIKFLSVEELLEYDLIRNHIANEINFIDIAKAYKNYVNIFNSHHVDRSSLLVLLNNDLTFYQIFTTKISALLPFSFIGRKYGAKAIATNENSPVALAIYFRFISKSANERNVLAPKIKIFLESDYYRHLKENFFAPLENEIMQSGDQIFSKCYIELREIIIQNLLLGRPDRIHQQLRQKVKEIMHRAEIASGYHNGGKLRTFFQVLLGVLLAAPLLFVPLAFENYRLYFFETKKYRFFKQIHTSLKLAPEIYSSCRPIATH